MKIYRSDGYDVRVGALAGAPARSSAKEYYSAKKHLEVRSIVPKWDTWTENAILYLVRYGSYNTG